MAISIGGRKHWLWRAVDQDGYVLDEIVQARRDTKAAKRLLIRVLKKQGLSPKRIVSDKLRSYGAARRDVMPGVEHRSHKGLNNRAENSHVPLRKRERMMQGFRSVGGLQRFIPVFSAVRNLFVPPHQKRSALATHIHRIRAMAHWKVLRYRGGVWLMIDRQPWVYFLISSLLLTGNRTRSGKAGRTQPKYVIEGHS